MSSSDEPFELLSLLGAGSFATAHKARVLDPELVEKYGTDTVALKIPHDRKTARALQDEVEQLIIVQRRLAPDETRNMVRYHGFEVYRGSLVMVMEYLPHGSLRDRIGRLGAQRPLPAPQVIALLSGVLSGLSVIHREHVIHRDIKPENILLRDDTPKIADFGISRILESNEFAATVVGTLFYIAPELLLKGRADFRADFWSLGVMAYELLTGRLPFGDRFTPMAGLVRLIGSGDLTPIREFVPDVPEPLAAVVARALSRDPDQRFACAQEMIQALARAAETATRTRIDALAADIRRALSEDGDFAKAERLLTELTRTFPDDPGAYQHLGELMSQAQRYKDAVETFRRGLACKADDAQLHWGLAIACQHLARTQEARESLERALALGLPPEREPHARRLLHALRSREQH